MYRTVILAGGSGTRLWPSTLAVNKHLIPIFDKPMIYYSLSLAMLAGSRTIDLIVNPGQKEQFEKLLSDGSQFGIEIKYYEQKKPIGIPDAFNIIQKTEEKILLILGDNLLYGVGLGESLAEIYDGNGCLIFTYHVSNPSDYGVINMREGKISSIEEKPKDPKSNLAIPGIYFFDSKIFDFVREIEPKSRGELEIVDVLNKYLQLGLLKTKHLERGTAWLDTGTARSMQSAGEFIRVIEERQGFKIGCLEEIALRMKFISPKKFKKLVESYPETDYKNYLTTLIDLET